MTRIVVFSGAGISAESGIQTFRAADGLWEQHRIEDVATPEAWQRDPALVLRFYNERRRAIRNARPNAAHLALAELERRSGVEVSVITQNIDDLHERAGSTRVLHLHGEIMQARSSVDDARLYDLGGGDIEMGDLCELGSQLRPHVVWFGEAVPMMESAVELVADADLFLVIGTSLSVYPAASLLHYVPSHARGYIVTLDLAESPPARFTWLREKAAVGVPRLIEEWRAELPTKAAR